MLVRSFNNDNGDGVGDGDENVITAIGLLSKTTSLQVYYAFLYISLPAVTARLRLKIPNFTFYEGRKQGDDKIIFLILNLSAVPKKSTPGKFAYLR